MALKDWRVRDNYGSKTYIAWKTDGHGPTDLRINFPEKGYTKYPKKSPLFRETEFYVVDIWTDYSSRTLARTKSKSKAMKVAKAYMTKHGPGTKRRTRKQHLAWDGFR